MAGHDAFFMVNADGKLKAVWVYARDAGVALRPLPADAWTQGLDLQARLSDPDPRARRAALEALVARDGASAEQALAVALADEDDAIRIRAIELASESDAEIRGAVLADLALFDRSAAVRLLALQSIEHALGARSVAERAIADTDPHVRIEAAAMLARLNRRR